LAAAAALIACAAVYSLAAPWLAARKVDEAFAALGHGSARAALGKARDAQSLNPLALQPLFAWAAAETLRGRDLEARRLYVRAVRLQPLNYRSWYELGAFELAYGDPLRARDYLHRAAVLDPQGLARLYLAG
jgi:Flp pilus assembly protein TadD